MFKKDLQKKYKQAFDITMDAIKNSLSNFSNFEKIKSKDIVLRSKCNKYLLGKFDFKVAGQNNTKGRDEYRYICFVNKNECKVYLLLIYSKNNIGSGDKKCSKQNETGWWKCLVRKYYSDFFEYLY